MRVAIDGPAGSGKSTVAHILAKRCQLTFLDTGAMYRAVAIECHENGIDPSDIAAVIDVAQNSRIEFGLNSDGSQTVFINGRDVTAEIRTPLIDKLVTPVSQITEVREALVAAQRTLGSEGDVVAEGRDIGTVVFPDAELKVFLVADARARALRRALQRNGFTSPSDEGAYADPDEVEEIYLDLLRRDEADSTREVSPLKAAEDAHVIDSSNLSLDEVIETILSLNDELKERADG